MSVSSVGATPRGSVTPSFLSQKRHGHLHPGRERPLSGMTAAMARGAKPPEGLMEAASAMATYTRVYQLGGVEDLNEQLEKLERQGRMDRMRSLHTVPPMHGETPLDARPRLTVDELYGFEAEWEQSEPGGVALDQLRDLHERQWMHSTGLPEDLDRPTGTPWRPST